MGSGGTPRSGDPRFYEGGTIAWAVIGDLDDGDVRATRQRVTEAAIAESAAKVVPAGTVLLAMYGSIGKLGVTQVPMATNQAIATLQPIADLVTSRWLFFYLLSQRSQLASRGVGATQKNISQTVLRPWPLPLPPLDEQHRIVAVLEDHLSRLDAAQDYLTASDDRLARLEEAVLQAAMRSGWPEVPLRQLLAEPLANGRSVPDGDGARVLRLTALRSGVVDVTASKQGAWTDEEASPFLVRQGDVLLARGNGSLDLVGRAAVVGKAPELVAFPDTMIRVRPDARTIEPGLLLVLWNSQHVRRQIEAVVRTTAGIYKINQKQLLDVRVPIPPREQQGIVLRELARGCEHSARHKSAINELRARRRALCGSLLEAALAGRL